MKRKRNSYNTWLINRYGGESSKMAIYYAVKYLIDTTHQQSLPTKLSEIAKAIGINPIPIYRNQTSDGQLIEINKEFRIALKMKSGKPPSVHWHGYPKLRFSYAHELIHCLHYDFNINPPQRSAPFGTKAEEEVLCNYGAGLLLLPSNLVAEYIRLLTDNDIIYVAKKLAEQAHTSLHATFLHLLTNNLLDSSKGKLYILSSSSEGYRERGIKKPRCLLSQYYLDNGKANSFLPPYKGLELLGTDSSLMHFHSVLFNSSYASEISVQNEIIYLNHKKMLLNGKHYRIGGGSYIWSDLNVVEL